MTDDRVAVWQYQVSFSNPDGEWEHVESLDHEHRPLLSLESAELGAPGDDYWLFTRRYDCTLDCE